MIWVDDPSDLSYLTQPSFVDCYCELITSPNDLILQALVEYSPTRGYGLLITMLTPDGETELGDITQYFEWYAFQGANGSYYLNMRLSTIPDLMCSNSCFILRVQIAMQTRILPFPVYTNIFDKYTERWCLDNCCLTPPEILVQQNYTPVDGEYDSLDYNPDEYLTNA